MFLPLKKSKVERHNDDIFINDTNSDKVSIERKFNCALRSDSVAEVPAKKRSPLTADLGAEFTPIEGTTELPYMTVVHVQVNSGSKMNHQQSTGLRMSGPSVIDFGGHNACGSCKDGGPLEDFTEAFGVTCKWKMNPSSLNRLLFSEIEAKFTE